MAKFRMTRDEHLHILGETYRDGYLDGMRHRQFNRGCWLSPASTHALLANDEVRAGDEHFRKAQKALEEAHAKHQPVPVTAENTPLGAVPNRATCQACGLVWPCAVWTLTFEVAPIFG